MAIDPSEKSLLIGSNHIRLKRVNSTNKYATDMIAKSKPMEGTVISASFQYEGRGQIGRFWESEENMNILCSTVLRPIFLEASDQFLLNIAVSLSVFDLVDHFLPSGNVKIKWPNDIYVDDKKIAGILVQNTLRGKVIDSSIIGTGINVNQVDFSNDIPNPTSIAIESNEKVDVDIVMSWLFRFMTKRYLQLKKGLTKDLKREYLDHLYRRNVVSRYKREDGTEFIGQITGIDDYGKLLILSEAGGEYSFAFREVRFVI